MPVHKTDGHSYTYTMMNLKEKKACDAAARDALLILPSPIRADIMKTLEAECLSPDELTDIRLRREGGSCISVGTRSYRIAADISPRKFDDMIFALTGGSLYAHAETIRDGYISVGGIRCGVCGRAVIKNGSIGEICDISSVSVRVARDVPGCSERVFELVTKYTTLSGVMIYSPPGTGKTTLLRDLIRKLSDAGHQFAVIDSRRELAAAARGANVDLLSGYPKADGIRCAVRSLSPELIVCDELSGDDDTDAAFYARSCGVPIIASAHAGSLHELRCRREMNMLAEAGIFKYFVGLSRRDGEPMSHVISEP